MPIQKPLPVSPKPPIKVLPKPGVRPPRGVKPMAMNKGGSVSSASKRADGVATKGKTRGKIC